MLTTMTKLKISTVLSNRVTCMYPGGYEFIFDEKGKLYQDPSRPRLDGRTDMKNRRLAKANLLIWIKGMRRIVDYVNDCPSSFEQMANAYTGRNTKSPLNKVNQINGKLSFEQIKTLATVPSSCLMVTNYIDGSIDVELR